ncbi:MAG: UDP-glucose/GDP-mannose dehydrogenase family protein [Patescibacteria group bacterium]|jgi:UDPglucose 6-dehydrogenase
MKICVIGTGYVGLVAAAVFADWGNEVVGVDIDAEKIKQIIAGVMPIYEPGLEEIVSKNIKQNRLSFTTEMGVGMKGAEVVFICVGTPQDDTGAADLSYVWSAAKTIGQNLEDYKVIVTKSTVPVGTNERVGQIVKENLKKPVEFDVASNPEFLKEGYSVEDMNHTDRTILGSNSQKAIEILKKIYAHKESPVVECDLRSAEMIKYASNAFLATKISFINEIAQICNRAGADVAVVGHGMGLDKRIGRSFLYPGIGYGGSCFPKDVAALYRTSTDQAYDFKLLRGVMEVNELQREYFVRNITRELGKNLCGKTIACLGLAFKENTDDARESISIKMIQRLRGLGANIRAFDYQATENAKHILGDEKIYYAKDEYDAMDGADALCLLTEWKQFRELDLAKTKKMLKGALIFDGRNLLDMEEVQSKGFTYYAVGRPTNGAKKSNGHLSSVVLS